jgi:diguanylate cyclase (GGDEF)-like protein
VRKGRVLVVDDSAAVRKEVVAVLSASEEFEVIAECEDGFAALKSMADIKPDLVLCDLVMPGCDGIQFLRLRAARAGLDQIPVLMLTSAGDQDRKVELLELGAADYITKPFHRGELLARVRIHCRLRVLSDDLKVANERLYELSCTDGLTGMFNRRHLDKVLEAEVSRHLRYGLPLGVILVDVDHFKKINDEHGHATGDVVLKSIGNTLKGLVRRADIVARYGGEEICIVLASTGEKGSMILAHRLRAAVEALDHAGASGDTVKATASFGVVTAEEKDPKLDVATLLHRADHALYTAKKTGRNKVISWNEMTEHDQEAPLSKKSD